MLLLPLAREAFVTKGSAAAVRSGASAFVCLGIRAAAAWGTGHMALEAAVAQLSGVAGVKLKGLPVREFNGIYKPAGEHEGWPRFENDSGKHLFRFVADGEWYLEDDFVPESTTPQAYVASASGPLPVDGTSGSAARMTAGTPRSCPAGCSNRTRRTRTSSSGCAKSCRRRSPSARRYWRTGTSCRRSWTSSRRR